MSKEVIECLLMIALMAALIIIYLAYVLIDIKS